MNPLKMYFLLNMGIFHCYVSLPEGRHVFFSKTIANRHLRRNMNIHFQISSPSRGRKSQLVSGCLGGWLRCSWAVIANEKRG